MTVILKTITYGSKTMNFDNTDFFRTATNILCSTLDLQIALSRLYKFLEDKIPVDCISFDIYNENTHILHNLITMRNEGFTPIPDIKVPKRMHESFLQDTHKKDVRVFYCDDSEQNEVAREVSKRIRLERFSGVICYLRADGALLGVAAFIRLKVNGFSQEEIDTLSTINEPLTIALANALRFDELENIKKKLQDDNLFLQRELTKQAGETVVGANSGLKTTMDVLQQVAVTDTPVMLLGETGVGKEVLASALHRMSSRKDGPFITVNCGAIPESLVDSVLFGYEKGAFTGAVQQRKGRFERANGGTLLLDEIGELPPDAQVRLLRVLQEKKIERVGGDTEIPIDARIITATHRDLKQLVKEGKFREDLWFRLSTFPVSVPPLRERKQDIPLLLSHFLITCTNKLGIKQPPVTPEGIEKLISYDWPGNARELYNVIEREIILSHGQSMNFDSLVLPAHDSTEPPARYTSFFPEPVGETESPMSASRHHQPELQETGPFLTIDELVRQHIEKALLRCHNKVEGEHGAAALLGINASTLRHRMRKLNISFGRKKK